MKDEEPLVGVAGCSLPGPEHRTVVAVECSALLEAARREELDRLTVPPGAIDVLAQQLVAIVAAEDYDEDRLFDLVRGAHPYRALTRPSSRPSCGTCPKATAAGAAAPPTCTAML